MQMACWQICQQRTRISLSKSPRCDGVGMKIRKTDVLESKAEGLCCGLPYSTELASVNGCSIHFWCGDAIDNDLLERALGKARSERDIVCAQASLGQPTGFWAHQE